MNPKDENKIIGSGKPNEVSKSPANTGHGEVRGQKFRGHGLVVGKGEKSILKVSA